jgi:hypothetical protein
MVQVELNDMYRNIGANNGSEKLRTTRQTLQLILVIMTAKNAKITDFSGAIQFGR